MLAARYGTTGLWLFSPTESQIAATIRQFPLAGTRLQFGSSGDSNLGGPGVWIFMMGPAHRRFHAYAADLASVLGHADRVRPFEDYCIGLLSAEGRKSVEPLAAVTAPERTAAQHQSLLHFVAQAPWSDQAVLSRVRERVLPSITSQEPIQAWIIDDTGFPKACPWA